MSPKASSDFGLYKETQKENNLRSIKFVLVVTVAVLILLLIVYATVHLIAGGPPEKSLESTLEKPTAKTEKLVLSESVRRELFQTTPAKPFKVTYHGQPPSEFTSTTEKITTLNYPQVNTFRHRYYPNNIQDVIGYATRFRRPVEVIQELPLKYSNNYKQSSSQYIPQNKRSTKNFSYADNDPFYLYKPEDPGEVNLLATASFRFAPPVWSNLKTKRIYAPPQYPLNIKRENEEREHKFGLRQFLNHRIENPQPNIRFPESKARKMVIHLNLYPNDVTVSESKMAAEVRGPNTPSSN